MSMTSWQQPFIRGGQVYRNAEVSIYLSGTTTPARLFNEAGGLRNTAPQLATDNLGYVVFSLDTDDYNTTAQTFDVVCQLKGRCSTAQDIRLENVALLQDSEGGRFWAVEANANNTETRTANDTQYVTGGTLATYASVPAAETLKNYGSFGVYDNGQIILYDETDTAAMYLYGGTNCRRIDASGGDFDIVAAGGDISIGAEDDLKLNGDLIRCIGDTVPDSNKTYDLGSSSKVWYQVVSQLLYIVSADDGDWWGIETTNNGVLKFYYSTTFGSFAGKMSLSSGGNLKTVGTMTQSTTLDS